jgi:hypothetical protein
LTKNTENGYTNSTKQVNKQLKDTPMDIRLEQIENRIITGNLSLDEQIGLLEEYTTLQQQLIKQKR